MANMRTYEEISVVSAEKAGVKNHIPHVPASFFAWGDLSLLDHTKAAVLNSRKSRRVSPYDRWLSLTEWCVRQAVEQGYVIVSSLGIMTYDWVCFLARIMKSPLIIVCDDVLPWMKDEKRKDSFFDFYGDLFDPDRTLFLSPFDCTKALMTRDRLPIRDASIVALADKLWIAEIRRDGNMEHLIGKVTEKSAFSPDVVTAHGEAEVIAFKKIALHKAGSGQYVKNALEPDTDAPSMTLSVPLQAEEPLTLLDGERYLIHFTRARPGPWPGQTMYNYLESLWMRRDSAAHTAFDTLGRILSERRIRGSSRLVRGPDPVVSFTACAPKEIVEMIHWNPALVRWSFEPYGIALSKKALIHAGAEPVIYARGHEYAQLPLEKRYRFQIHEPPDKDWTREKEWRIKGDLYLDRFSRDDLIVVLPDGDRERWRESRLDYRTAFI
jgi:hypothetical protein